MNGRRTAAQCIALALAAVVGWGCQRGEEPRYRGQVFEVAKPPAEGWTLVSDPARFAFPTVVPRRGASHVARWKAVEFRHSERRAAAEIFLLRPADLPSGKVMDVLLRTRQRQHLARGRPAPTTVGGRRGQASIAIWRPTRDGPRHCFYVVRVPLDGALWCFVGTAPAERFATARWHFRHILHTVRFHAPPPKARSKPREVRCDS
ncbi:MAG: hypothetical protein ACODAJ_15895 [Planctomycetota bacterium]